MFLIGVWDKKSCSFIMGDCNAAACACFVGTLSNKT